MSVLAWVFVGVVVYAFALSLALGLCRASKEGKEGKRR